MKKLLVALAALPLFGLVACSIGETNHESVTMPLRERKETRTCESPFAKPDLGSLEVCGGGKGHCYDGKKVPFSDKDLEPCGGDELCVPDKILAAGGSKLKSCAFFIEGKPGVCMSTLIKDIDANKGVLQKDVCDEDERCAPCINPMDGKDTHICEDTGAHTESCTGGEADELQSCCHGAGICMNEDGAPADQRDSLSRETCGEKKLCAPAALVEGKPKKCEALGMSGVCLDLCFAGMLGPTKSVMRGDCGPTEVCLPCVVGSSQDMPGCE